MALPIKDINQLQKERNQNYTTVVFKVSDLISYVCQAEVNGETITTASAVWRVKKIVKSGSSPELTKVSFANFDDRFVHIADNYATFTYLT